MSVTTDDDPLSLGLQEHEVKSSSPVQQDHHPLLHLHSDSEHSPWSNHVRDKDSSSSSSSSSKPMDMPLHMFGITHDPEATPTAGAAFPYKSEKVEDEQEEPSKDKERSDEHNANDEVSTSTTDKDKDHYEQSQPQASTSNTAISTPTKPLSLSALRAKVCRAAAKGDLQALLAVLHPQTSEDGGTNCVDNNSFNNTEDYPSSFALVNSPTASGLTPLLEAASHGHLHVVQHLLEEEGAVRDLEDVEGENAFLKASYRGHLHIMRYLARSNNDQDQDDGEDSSSTFGGTNINAADREGWTALHNASTKGYLEIAMWLCDNGAYIDTQSIQGYTPLMNAASKGHLPIIRYLLSRHSPNPFIRNSYNETAYDVAVATFELGIADILANYEAKTWQDRSRVQDSSSQSATTTSNNTPSNEYNNNNSHDRPYNPLGMHVNVPVLVYENQRLDLRWLARARQTLSAPSTSAITGSPSSSSLSTSHASQAITFTSSALSRRDGHASSEVPPSYDGLNATNTWIPARRSEICLPLISQPRQIRLPRLGKNKKSIQQRNTDETVINSPNTSLSANGHDGDGDSSTDPDDAAWFWLTDKFFVDLSPANIDPDQGWQYAKSLEEPPEAWSAEMPLELIRILAGDTSISIRGVKWVRRRRWARIMRRRLDIPHWGFDDDDDDDDDISNNNSRNATDESHLAVHDQEMGPPQDYLQRAQYFAGTHLRGNRNNLPRDNSHDPHNDNDSNDDDDVHSVRSLATVIAGAQSGTEVDRSSGRKIIARLERAIQGLKEGIESDDDEVRQLQAKTMIDIFEERLADMKREFPQADGDDDEEDTFRYPGADDESDLDDTASISTSLRSTSMYSPASGSPAGSRRPTSVQSGGPASRQQVPSRPNLSSISQHLSSNPDFRVPTSDSPIYSGVPTVSTPLANSSLVSSQNTTRQTSQTRSSIPWEPDDSTSDCRRCHRKFTFFLRKHHCRKCGLVVCAHCSSHHDYLRQHEIVYEPGMTSTGYESIYGVHYLDGGGFFRTCDICHEDLNDTSRAVNPDFLLAPQHFTSPRSQGLAGFGPISDSNTANSVLIGEHTTEGGGSPMHRSVSDISELGECPVCGTNLEEIPDKLDQEKHVQNCLESGSTSRLQDNRYLVFTLPASSPLVGTDCLICFEAYESGEQIGRLSCLCHFHKHCIGNWLSRGKSCPVHAR